MTTTLWSAIPTALKSCVRCRDHPPDRVAAITASRPLRSWPPPGGSAPQNRWGWNRAVLFEQSVNAMDTCRAIFMIPAVTGNYDVPGGFVESMEIVPAGLRPANELPPERIERALTGGVPFLKRDTMAHPYLMLEAIRTGKPYKIRGMFINANNTLLSMADARHSYDCLKELDFSRLYGHLHESHSGAGRRGASRRSVAGGGLRVRNAGNLAIRWCSQQKCVQVGECKSDEEFILELCRRAGWNYGFTDQRSMMEAQMQELVCRRPEYQGFSLDVCAARAIWPRSAPTIITSAAASHAHRQIRAAVHRDGQGRLSTLCPAGTNLRRRRSALRN